MKNIRQILLKARRQIIGDSIGNNPSLFRGEGYDFIELREYVYGDDTRHIDWNVTAKSQKPFVKVFREERELNVVSVAMLSGSMQFGIEQLKIETMAEIVALLGYSAVGNGDLFSHLNYSEAYINQVRPTKKHFVIERSVQSLLEQPLLNHSVQISTIAQDLYRRIKRRSLIVLIGDFFEVPDLRLLSRKHEVVAVIVRDRFEEVPKALGFTSLLDPETGAVLEGNFTEKVMKQYHNKIKKHDLALYERLTKDNVRFGKIYTGARPIVGLRRLFEGKL